MCGRAISNQAIDRLASATMLGLVLLLVVACGSQSGATEEGQEVDSVDPAELILPRLEAVTESEGPIRVVTTTGIIGDVVSRIAGDDAEVSILMAANQDPHGFYSTAGDLRLAADAHVIFVNGWRLEEGLIDDLQNAAGGTPMAPVSAGIEPRVFADKADTGGRSADELRIDPHVWLAPSNVIQWVDNIEEVLIALDPGNAMGYVARAEEYRAEVADLNVYYGRRLSAIDPQNRVLVTNHDAFGYFADEFGFEVVGTVIPGDSTLAEPSSRDLVSLMQSMREALICSIFVERSASQQLAEQLANDMDHCEEVQIVPLYSGALGPEGSGAESYLSMMRANVDAIVGALQPAEPGSSDD